MTVNRGHEQGDFQTFRTVFHYCFFIIAVPVATFFGSKQFIFDGILRLSPVSSNVWAAGITVVILHIILGLYIHRAFLADSATTVKPAKQD